MQFVFSECNKKGVPECAQVAQIWDMERPERQAVQKETVQAQAIDWFLTYQLSSFSGQ